MTPAGRRRAPRDRAKAVIGAVGVAAMVVALGAAAPSPANLSESERADVARVESYLSAIATMEARFLQVTSTGNYAEGTIYLARPGRLRIEYDPPVPIEIVADGRTLVYHDKKLKQVSYLGLDASPAGILLAQAVVFSGPVVLTNFNKGEGSLRLSFVKTDDAGAGSVTLVLEDQPLALKKWEVTDPQGVVTSVSLFAPRFGLALDSKLFQLPEPYPTEHRD